MLTKKQLKIIDVFRKNLGEKLTAEQIKKMAEIKSNNFLYKALSNCMHEGIITTQAVGRSLLYIFNINHKSASYLGMLASELYNLPQDILKEIEKEVSKKTSFFAAFVFGSYANRKQKRGSDLDIMLIVQNKKNMISIEPVLESIKRKELINIHYHIFTADEFIQMLKIDEENLGKQTIKNHLVFYNPDLFYNLIRQWIQ